MNYVGFVSNKGDVLSKKFKSIELNNPFMFMYTFSLFKVEFYSSPTQLFFYLVFVVSVHVQTCFNKIDSGTDLFM